LADLLADLSAVRRPLGQTWIERSQSNSSARSFAGIRAMLFTSMVVRLAMSRKSFAENVFSFPETLNPGDYLI